MAFCSSCGTQVADGVKFCTSCGKPVGGEAVTPKPAKEKVGNIKTCPFCGEKVESFQTRCSHCDHELNNVAVEENIQALVEQLYDISNDNWRNKESLIANFPIPNSREAIIEFILLASSKYDEENGYWFWDDGPWKIKLQQAYTKAKILFAKDPVSMKTVEMCMSDIAAKDAAKPQEKKKGKGSVVVDKCISVLGWILAVGLFVFLLFFKDWSWWQALGVSFLFRIIWYFVLALIL
jgi:hypothetical protein